MRRPLSPPPTDQATPRPAPPPQSPRRLAGGFPEGFRWGTATSAYRVEGAAQEGGRGASIWDTFTREPGRIRDGSTGHVSVDHYNRYREDVALMKSIGARTYRFSIAWPRVFPEGRGRDNPKGLDFYDRLVDELLASGIEPYATLYHWDLPQALQDRGGWESRDTAEAFGEYAAYIASRLTERVPQIFTINEMQTFVEQGHETGNFAPGLKLPPGRLNQVRHHAVLAHGLAVQAVRASGRRGTKVGPAENIATALPSVETVENIKAAELATRELNAPYLTVMMEGRYTDAYRAKAGRDGGGRAGPRLLPVEPARQFRGLTTPQITGSQHCVDRRCAEIEFPFRIACETWKQFSHMDGSSPNIRKPGVPAVPRWATL